MKYVIMADGSMQRWKTECDVPKHLLRVDNETLLERMVRQLRSGPDVDKIMITSHDHRYEVPGAVRYEPKNNYLEIDRFTWELIEHDTCFLYGDTYYTDAAIRAIQSSRTEEIQFFGTNEAIVAVIVGDADLMRYHIQRVKSLYLAGKIDDCRGWQVYQSYTGIPFGSRSMGPDFTLLTDETQGFNTYSEYEAFCAGKRGRAPWICWA